MKDAALNWTIIMIGNAAALVDKLISVYGQSKVSRDLELSNYAKNISFVIGMKITYNNTGS